MENFIPNISDVELFSGLIKDIVSEDPSAIVYGSLKEQFNARKAELNLTDNIVFKMLDLDAKQVKPILDGEAKRISLFTMIKLAYFLNTTLDEVLLLSLQDMSPSQISDIQLAKDAAYIMAHFDVGALTKIGFFKKGASVPELKARIIEYFGLNNLYEYCDTPLVKAFSQIRRKSKSDLMREFWLSSAFHVFEIINNPYSYDRAALIRLIPSIRACTLNEKTGLITVVKALYRLGITVIYQPTIKDLHLRGATLVVNDKPCIILSDYNNRYPTVWFALLHELCHVLSHLDLIREYQYHISDGDGDLLLLDEERCDNFASDYFLNGDNHKMITPYLDSPAIVQSYCKEWRVHPSIVYSIHCYSHPSDWKKYTSRIPKTDEMLKGLNAVCFSENPENEALPINKIIDLKQTIYV
ncbi:ImmA/IrrE family metallo-endopeptidase [Bacteroides acidifaciens]|jgi:Zn-dependent peptidase ImmA (M78 family)|uniref:ImmA/IrrE family metallo-endopeptidase n=1 Tax=Bacteroides acidifaciens TaxID=85831 RepID=UPI00259A2B3B|nr:pirin [Bacteroides acidifaciens]